MEDDPAPPARWRASAGRRTLLLSVAVVLAALAGVVVANLATRGAGTPAADGDGQAGVLLQQRVSPDAQEPLPDITLDGFAGGEAVALAAYRGQPLVLNFWATWCAPCVEEMPDFEQVWADVDQRVAFLGVNVQDSPLAAEPFVDELGISYDLAADPEAELYHAVRAFGMPTTLFVDTAGTIVFRHTGALDAPQLRALLGEHLGVDA